MKWTNILSNFPCRFYVMANLAQALIRERKFIPNLIFFGAGVWTFFGLFNGVNFIRLIYVDLIRIPGSQVQGFKFIFKNLISCLWKKHEMTRSLRNPYPWKALKNTYLRHGNSVFNLFYKVWFYDPCKTLLKIKLIDVFGNSKIFKSALLEGL